MSKWQKHLPKHPAALLLGGPKSLQLLGHLSVSYYAISFSLLNPCLFSQFPQQSPPKFFSLGLSLKCRSTLSLAWWSMPFNFLFSTVFCWKFWERWEFKMRLREKFREGLIYRIRYVRSGFFLFCFVFLCFTFINNWGESDNFQNLLLD